MQSYYTPGKVPVKLDDYICDLNLDLTNGGYSCQPLSNDGFSYMWAGTKATHGIRTGKVCYEVKISDCCEVSNSDPTDIHVARFGWSTDSSNLQLGEDKNSFGFGGTGKKSANRKFLNYGRRFEKGDVVGCYLAMENGWVDISYSVNGRYCGSAFKIRWMTDEALFPHVLTKNCKLDVNFGQSSHPYFSLQPGYKLIDHIAGDFLVPGVKSPQTQHECEVIMMVGLPGVGKSTWAINYTKIHPSKKYVVLGTDSIIDKMRVMGLPRRNNFTGRWDMLIKQASDCFNVLLKKASNLPRNLILDQTNVYASARRRKVKQYREKGYTVNAMVLVPRDEDMVRRSQQRTVDEGKEVPEAAVLDMKANFSLPDEREQLFDNITFLELQRPDAQRLVEQYNKEAMDKGHRSNQQKGVGGGNPNQMQRNQFDSSVKHERGYGQQGNTYSPATRGSMEHSHRPSPMQERYSGGESRKSTRWDDGQNKNNDVTPQRPPNHGLPPSQHYQRSSVGKTPDGKPPIPGDSPRQQQFQQPWNNRTPDQGQMRENPQSGPPFRGNPQKPGAKWEDYERPPVANQRQPRENETQDYRPQYDDRGYYDQQPPMKQEPPFQGGFPEQTQPEPQSRGNPQNAPRGNEWGRPPKSENLRSGYPESGGNNLGHMGENGGRGDRYTPRPQPQGNYPDQTPRGYQQGNTQYPKQEPQGGDNWGGEGQSYPPWQPQRGEFEGSRGNNPNESRYPGDAYPQDGGIPAEETKWNQYGQQPTTRGPNTQGNHLKAEPSEQRNYNHQPQDNYSNNQYPGNPGNQWQQREYKQEPAQRDMGGYNDQGYSRQDQTNRQPQTWRDGYDDRGSVGDLGGQDWGGSGYEQQNNIKREARSNEDLQSRPWPPRNPPTVPRNPPTGPRDPPTGPRDPPTGPRNPPTGLRDPPSGPRDLPSGPRDPYNAPRSSPAPARQPPTPAPPQITPQGPRGSFGGYQDFGSGELPRESPRFDPLADDDQKQLQYFEEMQKMEDAGLPRQREDRFSPHKDQGFPRQPNHNEDRGFDESERFPRQQPVQDPARLPRQRSPDVGLPRRPELSRQQDDKGRRSDDRRQSSRDVDEKRKRRDQPEDRGRSKRSREEDHKGRDDKRDERSRSRHDDRARSDDRGRRNNDRRSSSQRRGRSPSRRSRSPRRSESSRRSDRRREDKTRDAPPEGRKERPPKQEEKALPVPTRNPEAQPDPTTLSKLASVDFNKLKESLANIRKGQNQTDVARPEPTFTEQPVAEDMEIDDSPLGGVIHLEPRVPMVPRMGVPRGPRGAPMHRPPRPMRPQRPMAPPGGFEEMHPRKTLLATPPHVVTPPEPRSFQEEFYGLDEDEELLLASVPPPAPRMRMPRMRMRPPGMRLPRQRMPRAFAGSMPFRGPPQFRPRMMMHRGPRPLRHPPMGMRGHM